MRAAIADTGSTVGWAYVFVIVLAGLALHLVLLWATGRRRQRTCLHYMRVKRRSERGVLWRCQLCRLERFAVRPSQERTR